MDEREVPEFSAVQRAWLAEVHGVTLYVPVTLRPGMWVRRETPAPAAVWYVTQFLSSDGLQVLTIAWYDVGRSEPCWSSDVWRPVEGDYVECDPPVSWVAAGRPGAIDEQRPSGVWRCTVHEGTETADDHAVMPPPSCTRPSYSSEDAPCRWVELVYPASEEQ